MHQVPVASWATGIQDKEVLVLVHGYNTSFNAAIMKAVQVKVDMPWDGPIIAFSRPSYGDVVDYLGDEAIYGRSLPAFSQLLNVLQVGPPVRPLCPDLGHLLKSPRRRRRHHADDCVF